MHIVSFNNLVEISSCPELDLVLSFLVALIMSDEQTGSINILRVYDSGMQSEYRFTLVGTFFPVSYPIFEK